MARKRRRSIDKMFCARETPAAQRTKVALVAQGLSNKRVAAQLGVTEATIKAHLAKLVRDGHLVKQGVGRGTWYVSSGQ